MTPDKDIVERVAQAIAKHVGISLETTDAHRDAARAALAAIEEPTPEYVVERARAAVDTYTLTHNQGVLGTPERNGIVDAVLSTAKLPTNACLLRGTHVAHEWWYTSEGGGHMLSVADPTAKGFKAHWCSGRAGEAEDDVLNRAVKYADALSANPDRNASLARGWADGYFAAQRGGEAVDREVLVRDGLTFATEVLGYADMGVKVLVEQITLRALAARGDAAPTVTAEQVREAAEATWPHVREGRASVLAVLAALGIEVR